MSEQVQKLWNFCVTLTEILILIISAQINNNCQKWSEIVRYPTVISGSVEASHTYTHSQNVKSVGFLTVRALKRASIFVTWNLF